MRIYNHLTGQRKIELELTSKELCIFFLSIWSLELKVPVEPHKAMAEVSKLRNLEEKVVVVNH